jgi:8-oxo-dGTP diphosphatase
MSADAWHNCPYCGAELEDREVEGHAHKYCPTCDRIIFRNPVPAAGCVVEREGRVLLARRRHPPFAGHWYFPSGFVEYDEDVEATAAREIEEETGLRVEVGRVFGVYSYFDDPRKNGIIILFQSTIVGGELRAGDDASDVAFFPPDGLPEPIGFASHRRALRDWVQRRGAG